MNKVKLILPLLLLFGLLAILWHELGDHSQNKLTNSLIGEPLPAFALPTIPASSHEFTQNDLKGKVTLLHVWATWCHACKEEHAMLLKISRDYHVPIYSIVYRDQPSTVTKWLTEKGNPFVINGNDSSGQTAIDLGIYGTPETFVISPSGNILYRHVGMMDQTTWEDIIYPIFESYQ